MILVRMLRAGIANVADAGISLVLLLMPFVLAVLLSVALVSHDRPPAETNFAATGDRPVGLEYAAEHDVRDSFLSRDSLQFYEGVMAIPDGDSWIVLGVVV